MAAPFYDTDLTLISDADAISTWDESSDAGWDDGGGAAAETDYYIQGTGCISEILKTGIGTLIYDAGTPLTFGSEDVFVAWHYDQTPNVMGLYSEGGLRMLMGNTFGDFYAWAVLGRDYYVYGGWVCIPVWPGNTQDYTAGTPNGQYQFFGNAINHNNGSVSKGNPHGIDVIRYGRMESVFVGGDLGNGYCTIEGFALKNDLQGNRWGQIQIVDGGYAWQGLMSVGVAASAADFRDSNRNITILNPFKVYPTFNKIEIKHIDTYVEWNTFIFTALTSNLGFFEVVDNANVNLIGCSFTDMATFYFLSNSTITDSTFRRCNTLYQQGASFDGCLITRSTSAVALSADDLELITNCDFIAPSVSGHAIEIINTGTYIFDGNTFTDYASANGSTGFEAIYNTSQGLVVLNLQNTTSIPSIRNQVPNSTTQVNLSVTLTLSGLVSGSEIRIQEARGTAPSGIELFALESVPASANGIVQWTYNYSDFSVPYYIDIIVHNIYYTHLRIDDLLLPDTNSTLPIQQSLDRWYDNP